ncbi:MAG: BtrH N-terminal domain-containing protein [Halorientalis sp.]
MHRLDGYEHHTGNHCGSTSLRNLADYYDWGFDEPTCFGLASGLGFTFFEVPESPHRAFFGRPIWLERAFFEHLEIGYDHQSGPDWHTVWTTLSETIDDGDPLLLFTDIYYLDYYGTDTHFTPHALLAIGYEGGPEDGTVLLSDSEFDELQRLPAARVRQAMASAYMMPSTNRHLRVTDPEPGQAFADATIDAIEETARYMLDPSASDRELGPGTHGLAGVRALAEELPEWTSFDDPQWTVRFAYQNVERRGTGGGCFRKMYAQFLDTAAVTVPAVPASTADEMTNIAAEWTAVGETLKTASECDDTAAMQPLLADASDTLYELADKERRVFDALRTAIA